MTMIIKRSLACSIITRHKKAPSIKDGANQVKGLPASYLRAGMSFVL